MTDVVRDYPGFISFMEELVLPRHEGRPADVRLDGEPSGGNRQVVGRFWHNGRLWKVHADTRYEPLIVAYRAVQRGIPDPFVETPSQDAGSRCLELVPTLRSGRSRRKYMYIYEVARARS